MTDRQQNPLGRRAFLNRLMATTSIVATGAALRPAWGQHAHGHPPRLRAASPAAPPLPAAAAPSPAFANPPAIAGTNGNYRLNAAMVQTNLGTQPINVRAFVDANSPAPPNAPLVAPTITLTGNGLPVQKVSVQLANLLPAEPANVVQPTGPVTQAAVNDNPHGYNTLNLHTHGLHVDPLEDNVYIELQPQANGPGQACAPTRANPVWVCNGTYTYQYNFGQTPTGTTRIPAGTYWYHPHKHGAVGVQVASGMAGAFIVKGDLDAIPGVAGLTENVMVAQLIEFATPALVDPSNFYGVIPAQPPAAPTNQQISINGLFNPLVAAAPGQIQRWRFINATAEQFFYLNIAPVGTAPPQGPQLFAIAVDGVPLTNSAQGIAVPFALGTPAVTPTGLADTALNEIAVLAPGQRLDLLVQTPAAAAGGTYAVQAVAWPPTPGAVQTIATIQVSQQPKVPADTMPAASAFDANLFPIPSALYRPPLPPRSVWPILPTQDIRFGFNEGITGAIVNNSASTAPFGVAAGNPPPPAAVAPPPPPVGATPFALPLPPTTPPAPSSAQLNLKLGAVDRWQVGSDPVLGFGPHAFHIHINSFMMTMRNGIDISSAAIWRDTVRIDQGTTGNVPLVQFVSNQVDYVGDFVLHCHVLQHEDAGMMWSVNISA